MKYQPKKVKATTSKTSKTSEHPKTRKILFSQWLYNQKELLFSWKNLGLFLINCLFGLTFFLIFFLKSKAFITDAFLIGAIAMVCYGLIWFLSRWKISYQKSYMGHRILRRFYNNVSSFLRLNQFMPKKMQQPIAKNALEYEKETKLSLLRTKTIFYFTIIFDFLVLILGIILFVSIKPS